MSSTRPRLPLALVLSGAVAAAALGLPGVAHAASGGTPAPRPPARVVAHGSPPALAPAPVRTVRGAGGPWVTGR